jgi:ActR/RegA family two-component response regulator
MKTNKKLLLASDDLGDMAEIFIRSLSRKGVDVKIAESVSQALDQIKSVKFDLVVTDIGLRDSKIGGLDLIRDIRKRDKNLKIIVTTGFGDYYRQEALACGANDYFEKPTNIAEHILKPLGIESSEQEELPVNKTPAAPLRDVVHELFNNQSYAILVSSLLKESAEALLRKKSQELPADAKKLLTKVIRDMVSLETTSNRSNEIIAKVRDLLYERIDPDKTMIG